MSSNPNDDQTAAPASPTAAAGNAGAAMNLRRQSLHRGANKSADENDGAKPTGLQQERRRSSVTAASGYANKAASRRSSLSTRREPTNVEEAPSQQGSQAAPVGSPKTESQQRRRSSIGTTAMKARGSISSQTGGPTKRASVSSNAGNAEAGRRTSTSSVASTKSAKEEKEAKEEPVADPEGDAQPAVPAEEPQKTPEKAESETKSDPTVAAEPEIESKQQAPVDEAVYESVGDVDLALSVPRRGSKEENASVPVKSPPAVVEDATPTPLPKPQIDSPKEETNQASSVAECDDPKVEADNATKSSEDPEAEPLALRGPELLDLVAPAALDQPQPEASDDASQRLVQASLKIEPPTSPKSNETESKATEALETTMEQATSPRAVEPASPKTPKLSSSPKSPKPPKSPQTPKAPAPPQPDEVPKIDQEPKTTKSPRSENNDADSPANSAANTAEAPAESAPEAKQAETTTESPTSESKPQGSVANDVPANVPTGISSPSAVSARRRSLLGSDAPTAKPSNDSPATAVGVIPSGLPKPTSPAHRHASGCASGPAAAANSPSHSFYTPIPGLHGPPSKEPDLKPLHGLRPSDPLYKEAEAQIREAQIRREAQEAIRQRQREYDRITRVVNLSPRRRAINEALSATESGTEDETPQSARSHPPGSQLAPLVGDLPLTPHRSTSPSQASVSPAAIQAALEHRRHMLQVRKEHEQRHGLQLSPRVMTTPRTQATQPDSDRTPAVLPPIGQLAAEFLEEKRNERLRRLEEKHRQREAERQRERELAEAAQRAVQQRLHQAKPIHLRLQDQSNSEAEAARRAQILAQRRQAIEQSRLRRDRSQQRGSDIEREGVESAENSGEAGVQSAGRQSPMRHRSPNLYISRSLAMVREEEAQKHMEKQLAQEELRQRLLRAREYAANVPLPNVDIKKSEELERARLRELELQKQIEERRKRGEEALRAARKAEYRTPSVPLARAVAPPSRQAKDEKKDDKKPVAGHSALYRDYLKEARARRGDRPRPAPEVKQDTARQEALQKVQELTEEADRLDDEADRLEKQLARAVEAVAAAKANSNNDAVLAAQKEVDLLRTQSIRAKLDALKARQAAEDAMPADEEQ